MTFLRYNCDCGYRSMTLPEKAKCSDCGKVLISYINVLSNKENQKLYLDYDVPTKEEDDQYNKENEEFWEGKVWKTHKKYKPI